MKKIVLSFIAALGLIAGAAHLLLAQLALDKAPNRTNDLPALQNGAKLLLSVTASAAIPAVHTFRRLTDMA